MISKRNIFIFVICVFIYPIFLWATYIDRSVTEGRAYGFEIGESKKGVYQRLPSAFKELKGKWGSVNIQVNVTESSSELLATKPSFDIMIEPMFHEVGFVNFEKKDVWFFYINGDFNNMLKLEFCDGLLCKIYRHRKYFELP